MSKDLARSASPSPSLASEVCAPSSVASPQFAPGPWNTRRWAPFEIHAVPPAGESQIHEWIGAVYQSNPRARANVALIVAAPDLYEAATLALMVAESWIHDQLDGTSSLEGALQHLDPVRAALRKARGEVEPEGSPQPITDTRDGRSEGEAQAVQPNQSGAPS